MLPAAHYEHNEKQATIVVVVTCIAWTVCGKSRSGTYRVVCILCRKDYLITTFLPFLM